MQSEILVELVQEQDKLKQQLTIREVMKWQLMRIKKHIK